MRIDDLEVIVSEICVRCKGTGIEYYNHQTNMPVPCEGCDAEGCHKETVKLPYYLKREIAGLVYKCWMKSEND